MTTIIILAAGQGTRMNSALPKILHPLGGKAMVHHVIDVASQLNPHQIIVVASPHLDLNQVRGNRNVDIAIQEEPLGSGDAVRSALQTIKNKNDDILILCGDVPLLEGTTLQQLLDQRKLESKPSDILMLAMDLENPRHYGRLITTQDCVESIVEFKDASPEQRHITLCNSGIYLVPLNVLQQTIPLLQPTNAAGESYLTDIVAHAKTLGIRTRFIECSDPDILHGINNRVELAQAERHLQERWRCQMMLSGVTMVDPASVYLCHDTIVGADTIIYPNVFFGPEVIVGKNVTLYPGCYLQKSKIGNGAKVGPYAHLRDGTVLDYEAEVGNFVECKKSHFGPNAKAKHLSYLGDATIGKGANIGAGTITCNYNGFIKSKTIIGNGAFIGSNTALVAPVVVGDDAIVGAGSIITKDIPEGALAVTRAEQINKEGWAIRFRKAHQNK